MARALRTPHVFVPRFFLQHRDQVVDSVARCLKAGEDEKDELTASALGVSFGTLHENCTDKFQDEEFDEKLPMTKRIIVLPQPGCNTAFNEDDNGGAFAVSFE